MAFVWTPEKLRALNPKERLTLFGRVSKSDDPEAKTLLALFFDNDLAYEAGGGLPHDHPIMVEILDICSDPDAVEEAVAAADQGLPPLAGMEHRLVVALGTSYGSYNTCNYAGYCIATEMLARGWLKLTQKPMPKGCVAKTATTFARKDR